MPIIDQRTDVSVSHAETDVNQSPADPIHHSQELIADDVVTTKFQELTSEGKSTPEGEAVNRQTTSTPLLDEPCTPHTFVDLLDIHHVGDDMMAELTRPLSDCLSPLCTPPHSTCDKIIEAEPVLQLHFSPQDIPSSHVANEVPFSSDVNNGPSGRKKGMKRTKKVSSVVAVPVNKASEHPDNVKPAEKVTELTSVQKENLKRAGDEEESAVQKPKRPKDSSVESAVLSDRNSRNAESSAFKIPLKPNQERVAHRTSHHDRPALGKFGSYWNGRDRRSDDFRNRRSATDFRRFGWDSRRQYSSKYQEGRLTGEQLRWLNRMPTDWRP